MKEQSSKYRFEEAATMATEETSLGYSSYWRRKQLLAKGAPEANLLRWWPSEDLCEVERLYLEAISDAASVLDVGAGDTTTMQKLKAAGYRGTYHTMDVGEEYSYTYRDLDQVKSEYAAILFLDVLEHLSLHDGLTMLKRLVSFLEPGGVMVVQTANARCIRFPLSWDMTHLHCYNSMDLWAYLTSLGLDVTVYRVAFRRPGRSILDVIRDTVNAWITTRVLGCDYADNIVCVGRKPR